MSKPQKFHVHISAGNSKLVNHIVITFMRGRESDARHEVNQITPETAVKIANWIALNP